MSTLISMSMQPGTASPPNQQAIPAERIVVVCPNCQATLSVRRVYLGHQVLCKQCNHTFPVPDPAKPQAKSAFSDHNGAISKASFNPPDINAESRAMVDEHDQLRTEHDRHSAAHAHYKARYEQVSEELRRVTADLDGIRAHLGTVAPQDVQTVATERELLRSQIKRLSDVNQELFAERSAREQLAPEWERRESDFAAACAERDLFAQQLKQRDDDLDTARAENGRLRIQLQGALNELDQSRTTLVERDQALRSENDQLHAAVDSLREALAFAEQDHINDLNRFKEQLHGAHEEGHDLVVSPVENDQLHAELQAVRARVDDLERRLDTAELINRDMVEFLEVAGVRSIPV
jgi:chromosome segregation ATPase